MNEETARNYIQNFANYVVFVRVSECVPINEWLLMFLGYLEHTKVLKEG